MNRAANLWRSTPTERAEWAAKAHAICIEDELARRGFDYWVKPRHNNFGAPCPMCGGTDRFSVSTKKQLFFCRGCTAKGDVIDLVRVLDGVGYLDAITYLAGAASQRTDCSISKQPPPASKQPNEEAERQRKINAARGIWQRRRPIAGTVAEHYLRLRGLSMDEDLSHCIGFDPEAHWREMPNDPASALLRVPCLLAVYRLIDTDEIVAVQKTRLAGNASKIGRRFNGCPKGAVIKIDRDEEVTMGLVIGEGLETCLSGRMMGLRPCWALGSAHAIENLPLLPGIEGLHILREHDAANERAFQACAGRWHAAGHEVVSAWPEVGKDANDELRSAPS